MKINKQSYIHELPQTTQEQIKQDLKSALSALNLKPLELKKAVSDGLNSRLYDLEDTIDISKYLNA